MAVEPFVDLVPLLICKDVQASIHFYTDVLGFEIVARDDSAGSSGFATVRNGAARLMLASPAYLPEAPKVDGKYTQSAYYFYVKDADALRAAVVAAGWPAGECGDRFYLLREFEVADPDGHTLLFGHNLGQSAVSVAAAPGGYRA